LELVSEVLEAFNARVVPAYRKLRKGKQVVSIDVGVFVLSLIIDLLTLSGVMHGDFNEQNLIVRKLPTGDNQAGQTTEGRYTIAGIIDFGDLQNNYYVLELGITIAYMMLECVKAGIDPMEGSAHFLAGFMSKRPVPQLELELLRVREESESIMF